MQKTLALLIALAAIGITAQAAMVTVSSDDFSTFTLDIDGNASADITGLSTYSVYGNSFLSLSMNFDSYRDSVVLPGRATEGESTAYAYSPNAEDASSQNMWSGTWQAVSQPAQRFNDSNTSLTLNLGSDLGLIWTTGNKGSNLTTNPVSVIGLVVDSRNFDNDTLTGSVNIHYNYFGDFGTADGPQTLTLADTGFDAVPEPATALSLLIGGGLLAAIRRWFPVIG